MLFTIAHIMCTCYHQHELRAGFTMKRRFIEISFVSNNVIRTPSSRRTQISVPYNVHTNTIVIFKHYRCFCITVWVLILQPTRKHTQLNTEHLLTLEHPHISLQGSISIDYSSSSTIYKYLLGASWKNISCVGCLNIT